jgi:hypothetical protein
MSAKRVLSICAFAAAAVLVAAAIRASGRPVVAEAPRAAPPLAPPGSAAEVRSMASSALAIPTVTESYSGAIVEQTFTLEAGWNPIYLGVEPINPSAYVVPPAGAGTPTPTRTPGPQYEKSLMEAVFEELANSGALDSVWTYTQPVSGKDYIVDPGEGLWDEPGWQRYIPEESRAFLTTLHTLHANTGYLVKMNAAGTITVRGKPVPGHHRWQPDAYNLAGFPIAPGSAPSVSAFIAGSPITEIRALNTDGTWSEKWTQTDTTHTLAPGVAYLVRYASEPAVRDYTAPLDLASGLGSALPSDGLEFGAGLYRNRATLMVKNQSAAPVDVLLSLAEGASSQVAVQYVEKVGESEPSAR